MNFRKSIAAAAFMTAAMGMFVSAATAATCTPPKNGDWTSWLKSQESTHITYNNRNISGHTLACHVGVSVNGHIHRIESAGGNGCQLPANGTPGASSWSDPGTLINALKTQEVLTDLKNAANSRTAGTIEVSGMASQNIGTTVAPFPGKDPSKNRMPCANRKDYTCQSVKNWKMIIRTNGTDCILLTAYPTP